MGKAYWVCEGIGIRTSELFPFLSTSKCIELIKEQTGNDVVPEEDGFDIGDYLYGTVFENLADMLCHCDDTSTLTYGDNGDGEHYFYYIPTYPWNCRVNEPKNISEVHERIKNAVMRICDISEEQIKKLIDDDIYDVGCG